MVCSCTGRATKQRREQVDSLNALAYGERYRSLDETERQAKKALDLSEQDGSYADGSDEAKLHLAFTAFMRMDYEKSEQQYKEVLNDSRNELLKLVADVGMMRLCQRQSANKDFYDYRNSAVKRMERLGENVENMDAHQRLLWNYACSDFYLTLSTYYYYLRQEDQGREAFEEVANHMEWMEGDSAQLTLYYFLIGNSRNVSNQLDNDDVNHLMRAVSLGHQGGYGYVESKALTSLAEDMTRGNQWRPSRLAYLRELYNIDPSLPDSMLCFKLSERALSVFQAYGSLFDVSQTYIALSDFHMLRGEHQEALELLDKALMPETQRVPEWLADVMEHYCLVYSSMGMKQEADENRNIYLDILNSTRQDQRMEQRLATLQEEEQGVNRAMLMAIAGVVVLVLLVLYLSRRIRANYRSNYEKEQKAVEQEMERWRARSDQDFSSLEERQEGVEAERYMNERRLEEQKRQYIDKMTCLSLVYAVTPFLDRAVHAAEKTPMNMAYLSELIDKINEYNDILTHWVKVRQGSVSLNIENFELEPLFEIMKKNQNVFKNKQIDFSIESTEEVVKADKALTLFMMNTLLENARKYTPEGGKVALKATSADDYVEVSVSDTGRGLSEDDVNMILGEKVYDSSKIGDTENDPDLQRNKGFGFGLMNCKGIIEKYKKTNSLFAVCKFGIDSKLGQGSRFFFRLPKGVMRQFGVWVLCLLTGMSVVSCGSKISPDRLPNQSMPLPNDPLLEQASNYADSAYFANVDGYYVKALAYVDSACGKLNDYYLQERPRGHQLLHLIDSVEMPEIDLRKEGFVTDYHIVLDIRNEAAIAALALKQFDVYYYNNEIYTRLYKLMAQDTTLEQYCNDIKEANSNKQTILLLVIALFVLGLVIYFMVYYRNNILTTFNMRQILDLNRRIFNNEEEAQLANIIQEGVNDVKRTDGVCLMFLSGSTQYSDQCPRQDYLHELLHRCIEQGEPLVREEGAIRVYPLKVQEVIGALAIVLHSARLQRGDDELFQLIAQHAATNIYYSTVRMEHLHTAIELLEDEKRRAEMEANHVHVQNMVLDNCLSTIKHETMYYPSRIKQILQTTEDSVNVRDDGKLTTIRELLTYYKEVYSLLSACAARQLDTVLFRRHTLTTTEVMAWAEKVFKRLVKKGGKTEKLQLLCQQEGDELQLIADPTMLQYLVENVVSAFFEYKKTGTIQINFAKSEDFVKFAFAFDNVQLSREQLHGLFYPDNLSYDADTDTLQGAQYLITKQVIREHDEHVRRGCRIYAEPLKEYGTGICITFTIPAPIGKG